MTTQDVEIELHEVRVDVDVFAAEVNWRHPFLGRVANFVSGMELHFQRSCVSLPQEGKCMYLQCMIYTLERHAGIAKWTHRYS